MMGRRQKLKGGDEWDVVSKWRKILVYCSRPGVTKTIKKKMNRRDRKAARLSLKDRL